MAFGPRRAVFVDITATTDVTRPPLSAEELARFETVDLLYRSLCTLLYNYAPTSGHPGGSISSGRFMQGSFFESADYDLSDPDRRMPISSPTPRATRRWGCFALWALRDEMALIAGSRLLPAGGKSRLRMEDLLGLRRNPVTAIPLFQQFGARALDGHPAPATPFVRLSTGVSGVYLLRPPCDAAGIDAAVYYVASVELFDLLPPAERRRIFPEADAQRCPSV